MSRVVITRKSRKARSYLVFWKIVDDCTVLYTCDGILQLLKLGGVGVGGYGLPVILHSSKLANETTNILWFCCKHTA